MFKIKKAILTGGGRATRLRPITATINKHLIPLANKPMIFHAIEKAVAVGIKEIFININPEEIQLQKYVGDGGHWRIKIKFFVQDGGPQGIAHVVKCAEEFIGKDPFMFYLSDNIILGSLEPFFTKFDKENLDCLLALARVPDPERFGVPEFDSAGKLIDVIEKPLKPPSNFAVTGIYLFKQHYFKAFDQISKSARGEYEIPSIFSYFLKNKYRVGYEEITGWWKDTGKPEDLLVANTLLLSELPAEQFKNEAAAPLDATITGNVQLGSGTTLGRNVKIIGPVLVGENGTLENCTIGPYVTIGAGTTIKNATIQNSIILKNCYLDAARTIKDSIIGEKVTFIHREAPAEYRLVMGDYTWIESQQE